MKITVSQLRQLIREAVEEAMHEKELEKAEAEMKEADIEEGLGDDTDYTGAPEGKYGQDDHDSEHWSKELAKSKEDTYDKPY